MHVDDAVWKQVYYSTKFYLPFYKRELIPLFAVESGSRAWGFASDDSDFDVRLVYRHHRDKYLQLGDWKDTVELQLEFGGLDVDVVGWDVRKFLQLAKKSNAQPFEWLFSCPTYPVVGPNSATWFERARDVVGKYLSPVQMAYHYRGMMTKHWRRYMEGRDEVTHKKYLYLLRAMAYMEWYLEHGERGVVAPGNFLDALNEVSDPGVPEAASYWAFELVRMKQAGHELGKSEPIPDLDGAIRTEVERWANGFGIGVSGSPGWQELDTFFLWTLENT